MKKIIFILAMLFSPSLLAATLTANTVPYVCQGGTSPQLCNSNTITDSNGNISGIIPMGGIIEWYGNIASIPSGWTLCNGVSVQRSDGKGMITPPDLRNRFIAAADADSNSIAMSTITGSPLQLSDGQLPVLTVSISGGQPSGGNPAFTYNPGYNPGTSNSTTLGHNFNVSGAPSTGGSTIVARFYALAYIMKT